MSSPKEPLPPSPDARPEKEALLWCARAVAIGAETPPPESLFSAGTDWPCLIEKARRHGMLLLLYRSLRSRESVPPAALGEMRAYWDANLQRNLRMVGELERAVRTLRAESIPALAYKGPALAVAAYGNWAFRACADLDILVPEKDVPTAIRALLRAGYRDPKNRPDRAYDHLTATTAYHLLLQPTAGEGDIELHWGIMSTFFSTGLDPARFWDRPLPSGISDIETLSAEHLLWALCCHGARHRWQRLEWVCSLASLIRQHIERNDLDWPYLLALARQTGTQRVVALGLALSADLLEATPDSLPSEARAAIAEDGQVDALRAGVWERLLAPPQQRGLEYMIHRELFLMRIRERRSDRLRHIGGMLFARSPEDLTAEGTPRPRGPLFLAIRMLRLTRRHGSRLPAILRQALSGKYRM